MKVVGTNVTLYKGEPGLFISDPDGPVIRDLDRRMTRAQGAAQRFVRRRTGRLFSSIRKNRGTPKSGPYVDVIAGGSGIKYTMYEHDGTPPHIIRANRRKSLRWVSGGNTISGGGIGGTFGGNIHFAKQVRHPGTTGSFFLERALPFAGG